MRRATLLVLMLGPVSWPSTVATAASGAVTPTAVLPCRDQIDSRAAPEPELVTTLGQVALPTRDALGAVDLPNEPDRNVRYWAKQGLVIKVNASFELVVPPEWRGRLSFGWGNPGQPTTRLKVSGCRWMPSPSQASPRGAWLGFAGGFHVRTPACVPVLVKAGHQTRRVRIGVGAPCPGQSPPPHAPNSG